MNESINDIKILNSVDSNNTELLNEKKDESFSELDFNGFTPIVSDNILKDVSKKSSNDEEVLETNQDIDNLFDDNQEIETLSNYSAETNKINNSAPTLNELFNLNIDSEVTNVAEKKETPNIDTSDVTEKMISEPLVEDILPNENLDVEPSNIIDNHVDDNNGILENIEVENIKDDNISNIISDNNEENKQEIIKEEEKNNILEEIPRIEVENIETDLNNTTNYMEEVINNNPSPKEAKKEEQQSLLQKYGENLTARDFVCNPAIGRDNEIKQLILTLLTPEKSAILVGKPGIGKTAIVEGLGYQIKRGNVPLALGDYTICKLNTSSLLGIMPDTNEPKIQVLLNELKGTDKLILFIDEIHTLIGAGAESGDSLDFANIFKPGLDRGSIKIIGATTSDEYDRYILTDKAFVRRFQKIEVLEPTKEHTVKILMGSLPKLEHKTCAKLKYTPFIQEKIMKFIVDITSEYRRVYELSARYPDVSLTILQQAFSYAVFDNKKEVSIRDVRKAIANTKLVYPDVIKKELIRFNEEFHDIYHMETVQRLRGETSIDNE